MVAQSTLRMREGNQFFAVKYLKFGASVDVNKCLEQIELPNFHSKRAHGILSYHFVPWVCNKINT